jgi:hypothetical protein
MRQLSRIRQQSWLSDAEGRGFSSATELGTYRGARAPEAAGLKPRPSERHLKMRSIHTSSKTHLWRFYVSA